MFIKVFTCHVDKLEDEVQEWLDFWDTESKALEEEEIIFTNVTQSQVDDIVTLVLFCK